MSQTDMVNVRIQVNERAQTESQVLIRACQSTSA
jgi:hypothetical protein